MMSVAYPTPRLPSPLGWTHHESWKIIDTRCTPNTVSCHDWRRQPWIFTIDDLSSLLVNLSPMATNVLSKSCAAARPRTWQKKRRAAAVSNCRAVIFLRHTFDGNQATGEWRLDVGRATLGECRCCLGWHMWKIQGLRHEYVPLKHYTFPRTLNKLEGTLMATSPSHPSQCRLNCESTASGERGQIN